MAELDGECSVLLTDGMPCRRAARFCCSEWHLVCASHQPEPLGIEPAGCPLCGGHLMVFSHLETMRPGGRRASDGFMGSVGAFFIRAREALLFELHDEPPSKDLDIDLENEI